MFSLLVSTTNPIILLVRSDLKVFDLKGKWCHRSIATIPGWHVCNNIVYIWPHILDADFELWHTKKYHLILIKTKRQLKTLAQNNSDNLLSTPELTFSCL